MRATENRKESKKQPQTLSKKRVECPHSSPLDLFDRVQICSGLDLMSNPSFERWTEFGLDCTFIKQSASISLVPTCTSLTSGRVLCEQHTSHVTFSSCFTAHILMSHSHWLKNKVCGAHFIHVSSSCAHVVCCLILSTTLLSTLCFPSSLSSIFLFILLFFAFFFHVGDKNPAHSCECGFWHPGQVRSSHRL